MQHLIGLYSPSPGCGKTTVARHLSTEHHYTIHSFAEPLRKVVRTFLLEAGVSFPRAVSLLRERKEEPIPEVCGLSGRHLLRTLGTEWGRQCVHPDIWLRLWEAQYPTGFPVVVDDVRFPNEAQLIKARGGQLWRIERPQTEQLDLTHASDGGLEDFRFHRTIVNDGSLADLEAAVEDALK